MAPDLPGPLHAGLTGVPFSALGLGLSSVAFFGVVGDTGQPGGAGAGDGAADALRASFVGATTHALWWVCGGLVLVFGLLFLLPRRIRAREAAEAVEPAAPEGGAGPEQRQPALVS
ncbi:hypothetical protein [Streptomyces decoyicus]|uniref:hypothetical protein n=1 Tax=Streptomyces decoyicus TaxID=249567 RepID=UPI00069DE703|nr:hypothetical protein [Streptomyces decoyicus]KOG42151.1 hypothetical protein ADK74_17650 [Streptomyces decoyicus]